MEFLYVMGAIILAGISGTAFFFRKGGIYNPLEEPDNTPMQDFTDLPYLPPEVPVAPVETPPTALETIYEEAKANLGKRLTLNASVPVELGCVQAVSFVLWRCGYPIPPKGIDGVNALIDWMLSHGFKEVKETQIGAVITAHRPKKGDPALAHAGICGKTHVMSNNSYTIPAQGLTAGLFQANYAHASWHTFFSKNGLVTRYFVPK